MKQQNLPSSSPKAFRHKLLCLWPALKGSVAQVYKPCIRVGCRACARGEKHPAFLLAFTQGGRRRCMYVPKRLVPLLQRALKNGRRIEELLYKMGPALIREHRQSATRSKAPKPILSSTKPSNSKRKPKMKS